MKEDRPLQDRVRFTFLYGLKKLLADLHTRVTFDAASSTLSFNGKDVLRVHVEGMVLKRDWLDSEWADWSDLFQNEKYKAFCADVQQKLDRAKASAKGDGKGPSA